jgi:hypothetical protein
MAQLLLTRVGLKTGDLQTLAPYDNGEEFTQYGKLVCCAGPNDVINITLNGVTMDLNSNLEINWPITSITVNKMVLANLTGGTYTTFTTTGSTFSGQTSQDSCVIVMGAKHNKRDY